MDRALILINGIARDLLTFLLAILYLPAAQAPSALVALWRVE